MRAIACIAFVAAALMAPACGGSRVTTDGAPRPLVDAGAPDSARPEDAGEPGGDDAATAASTGAGPFTVGHCGFSTCPNGCCLDDGGCFVQSAATDVPCGSNGERCTICPAGQSCSGGGCQQTLDAVCGPSTCAGCCLLAADVTDGGIGESAQCFEGTQDDYCGSAGGPCTRCSPSTNGGHCVAGPTSGGHCEGADTCNATNCAGCCSGGLCVEGTQDVGCGSRGANCQDCTAAQGVCASYAASDGLMFAECAFGCHFLELPVGCASYCTAPSVCSPMMGP